MIPDPPRLVRRPLSAGDKKRLAIAFIVAAVSDSFSAWLEFVARLQWAIDVTTAGLLFLILGRQWLLLPGLIAEAIPGLAVLSFWMLVVASIALRERYALAASHLLDPERHLLFTT
ncbi:MAG TPA: hypothetical protein VLZ12_08495 [Verrucomicrobiae bacterium]|nr:hypothetical protein [Verrucomicrobiae bacterium]